MNPLLESKKTMIIACVVPAMAYALLVGRQPMACRVADGVIYAAMLFLSGHLLWNIFRYAIPAKRMSAYQWMLLVALSVITILFVVGIETFTVFIVFPDCFADFVPSIPIRLFITWLLFVIYRLFYTAYLTEETILPVTGESLPATAQIIDRITVRSGNKIKIIPVGDIIFLRADGDYVDIYTAEGHWLKEQTMKYSEDILPPDRFVRTHRSYIVNIHHISRIERYGEQQLVILSNGEKIKISNARYQILKQRLGL
ncbi:MAG: LytTR family transcriptional regulator [Tannerella sp.]|jgi:hypothetical protein|nr:LytTR family transcriptional regulator [Tannerella sp.]